MYKNISKLKNTEITIIELNDEILNEIFFELDHFNINDFINENDICYMNVICDKLNEIINNILCSSKIPINQIDENVIINSFFNYNHNVEIKNVYYEKYTYGCILYLNDVKDKGKTQIIYPSFKYPINISPKKGRLIIYPKKSKIIEKCLTEDKYSLYFNLK